MHINRFRAPTFFLHVEARYLISLFMVTPFYFRVIFLMPFVIFIIRRKQRKRNKVEKGVIKMT